MGHTNETVNVGLPQFISTDKPTWLGDINGAFQKIDTEFGNVGATATGAEATANAAAAAATNAVATANAASTAASNAETDAASANALATEAVGTANNAQSTAVLAKNTADAANAKVGNLNNLVTENKSSVVEAINEIATSGTVLEKVTVTADGVKTSGQLLAELDALIDNSKIRPESVLMFAKTIFEPEIEDTGSYTFSRTHVTATTGTIESIRVDANAPSWYRMSLPTGTIQDITSYVQSNGTELTLTY